MYDGQIGEVNLFIILWTVQMIASLEVLSVDLTGVIQIKVQVKNVYLSASVRLNSKSISFAILQLWLHWKFWVLIGW